MISRSLRAVLLPDFSLRSYHFFSLLFHAIEIVNDVVF